MTETTSTEQTVYPYMPPPGQDLEYPLTRFQKKTGVENVFGQLQRRFLTRNGFYTNTEKDYSLYYESFVSIPLY